MLIESIFRMFASGAVEVELERDQTLLLETRTEAQGRVFEGELTFVTQCIFRNTKAPQPVE
jgi:hypothetical protein